jgi:cytidylate kinase
VIFVPSIDEIINRQFRQWEMQKAQRPEESPEIESPMEIVTISRECGSRGAYFAVILAEKLGYQLIHKEIVDAICTSSGYRRRIIASLDQKYRSRLELMIQSFVTGQAFDHSDYSQHLVSIVLSMARLGGVVLVGRGGNFILGPDRGYHIRLVSTESHRIRNLMKYCNLSEDEAVAAIERSDAERSALIRKVFRADIDDPHYYDAIVNTAYVNIRGLVDPVIAAIKLKMKKHARPRRQTQ